MLLTGFIQGAGSELPYLLGRYKKFGPVSSALSGISAAIFSFAYNWIRFGYGNLQPSLVITMLAVRVASGAILGGLLGWIIVKSLDKTGVPRSLGLGQE